jgi:hypothetical protein
MEQDDSDDRNGTPAIQGGKVYILTTQLRLRNPDRGNHQWRMPVEAIRWEIVGGNGRISARKARCKRNSVNVKYH